MARRPRSRPAARGRHGASPAAHLPHYSPTPAPARRPAPAPPRLPPRPSTHLGPRAPNPPGCGRQRGPRPLRNGPPPVRPPRPRRRLLTTRASWRSNLGDRISLEPSHSSFFVSAAEEWWTTVSTYPKSARRHKSMAPRSSVKRDLASTSPITVKTPPMIAHAEVRNLYLWGKYGESTGKVRGKCPPS